MALHVVITTRSGLVITPQHKPHQNLLEIIGYSISFREASSSGCDYFDIPAKNVSSKSSEV